MDVIEHLWKRWENSKSIAPACGADCFVLQHVQHQQEWSWNYRKVYLRNRSLKFNSPISREVPEMIYSDCKAAGYYIVIMHKTLHFNHEKSWSAPCHPSCQNRKSKNRKLSSQCSKCDKYSVFLCIMGQYYCSHLKGKGSWRYDKNDILIRCLTWDGKPWTATFSFSLKYCELSWGY